MMATVAWFVVMHVAIANLLDATSAYKGLLELNSWRGLVMSEMLVNVFDGVYV